MKSLRTTVLLLAAVLTASVALAQGSRGSGRISGKVVDEQNKPIVGVTVKAQKVGETQVFTATTNNKGEWALGGLAGGQWNVDFEKEGLDTVKKSVNVTENSRVPPMPITMKPAPPKVDPNAEINKEMQRAGEHVQAGRLAEARKIYEDLLAKYPNVHQFHNFIGRTYAAENNFEKSIEHVTIALEKDPANLETKMLLAELYQNAGKKEEAQKLLDTIDMTQAKDPFVFMNAAINKINEGKAQDAIDILTKLAAQFPNEASIFYYRGRAHLVANKWDEAKADLEKFVAANPESSAKEVADAKKILEQLVKK